MTADTFALTDERVLGAEDALAIDEEHTLPSTRSPSGLDHGSSLHPSWTTPDAALTVLAKSVVRSPRSGPASIALAGLAARRASPAMRTKTPASGPTIDGDTKPEAVRAFESVAGGIEEGGTCDPLGSVTEKKSIAGLQADPTQLVPGIPMPIVPIRPAGTMAETLQWPAASSLAGVSTTGPPSAG